MTLNAPEQLREVDGLQASIDCSFRRGSIRKNDINDAPTAEAFLIFFVFVSIIKCFIRIAVESKTVRQYHIFTSEKYSISYCEIYELYRIQSNGVRNERFLCEVRNESILLKLNIGLWKKQVTLTSFGKSRRLD